MGYQITQYDEPIVLGGEIEIAVVGEKKKIGITRAHIEADAGKSTHPVGKDYSLVDLNRAGTPLLEIVSEPELHSSAEAKAYARELWLRMKYADVSDADLYYGNMRFDVNVSVSKTDELGTRSETKNLNSFRSVEKAVDYEVERQIELLEKGGTVVQETRGWDDAKQKTFSQRTKEDAHDYRYFPDPDLPPVTLTDVYIEEVKTAMPLLPEDYRRAFESIDIETKTAEDIISVPDTAKLVARILKHVGPEHARRVAFWMMLGTEHSEEETATQAIAQPVKDEQFIALSQFVSDNKLNSTAAKEVLMEMLKSGEDPEKIAEAKNLLQVSDEGVIAEIVKQVLAENPKAAEDVKNGEMKAIGFLVGQVMKVSQGKANPALAQELIKKQLGL
jgi:aspartyl-tRNA(Asn)/glutamyl-tRNA(Gln) amidotransferase subunit B